MRRRVKDYWTFLKENEETEGEVSSAEGESSKTDRTGSGSPVLASTGAKKITTVLDPHSRRTRRRKTKDEIEREKSKDGKNWVADSRYTYDESEGGYVGWSRFHFGKVVLLEIEEEGETERIYRVLSGPNKGLEGNYEWQSGDVGTPLYDPPLGKKWKDILGPDEEFFKNFTDWGGGSPITDVGGVELVKVGNKGECEIRYEDRFQFYGKVRIYYDPDSYDSFSYEVLNGPNQGKKSQGLVMQKNGEGLGIYNPFSKGELLKDVVEFPPPFSSNAGENQSPSSRPDKIFSKSSSSYSTSSEGVSGYNQRIFLNTTELESINPPTEKGLLDKYENTEMESMMSREYKTLAGDRLDWTIFSDYLPCLGKIKKSELTNRKFVWVNHIDGTEQITLDRFPKILSPANEVYVSYYMGNPILLYSVKSKKQTSPPLDWNQEIGTYGNNFFVGMIYDDKSKQWEGVKGEWYYDYVGDYVGIVYAYKNNKKKVEVIINLERDVANPKAGPGGRYDKYLEKPGESSSSSSGSGQTKKIVDTTFDSEGKVVRFGGAKW